MKHKEFTKILHRKTIIVNTVFALNCLLLFLFIFEKSLQIPAWIQVMGRMHPLLLHFPIVLLILCIFWELTIRLSNNSSLEKITIGDWLLLSASFTAVSSAIMGLFLSKEAGYKEDALIWHKWGGIVISVLSFTWYIFRDTIRMKKIPLVLVSLSAIILLIITGDMGANITHGENFLLAPVSKEKSEPNILLEDAEVFANMVQPILKSKCISCHNAKKAKGELVMETTALLKKGGKSGVLWDSTEKDLGLLLRRIHLPADNKKHMPPVGKPQLSEDEATILLQWIRNGAAFTGKVSGLAVTDTLHAIATTLFSTIETDEYSFQPASENKIKALHNNYRMVTPLAKGSPALGVSFFSVAQFKSEQLKELLSIKEQVVSLNLNKMPVHDEDLTTIAQFVNLRKLNLSFTDMKGPGLVSLQKLALLKQLSLSGTGIHTENLGVLGSLPKLTHLYIWSTPAQSQNLTAIRKQLKNTIIESGFAGDTVRVKLNPAIIENEEQILLNPTALQLKHYVKGVTLRYTTNGTEPDSLQSPVYKNNFVIKDSMTVKVKAYKPGWISSNTTEMKFYKAGYKIDSVWLLQPPDPQYKSIKAAILIDGQKGDFNTGGGKWLGYRGYPMQAILYFATPKNISSVTISSMVNIGSYIMPPHQIDIWVGNEPGHLRLLKSSSPEQPVRLAPGYMKGYTLSFSSVKEKYFKIVVTPVSKLPRWHKGKGDKGWIFVDEIFVN